ncbi:MAG: hypothetical protein H6Q64_952 [Firmicutes bacterium]|nr:hypothetical protein [Bacillota bacterium]
MNKAILLSLTIALVFLLYKSGWLSRHIPRWKSTPIEPDAVVIQQRLQEIAGA